MEKAFIILCLLVNLEYCKQFWEEAANSIGVFAQPSDPDDVGLTVWMPDSFYLYKKAPILNTHSNGLNIMFQMKVIEIYSSKAKPTGPYVVVGASLPDDAYNGVKQMLPYFQSGNTAPALEFITSVKDLTLLRFVFSVWEDWKILKYVQKCMIKMWKTSKTTRA